MKECRVMGSPPFVRAGPVRRTPVECMSWASCSPGPIRGARYPIPVQGGSDPGLVGTRIDGMRLMLYLV